VRAARDQSGFVVVTAIMIIGIMIAIGLAGYAYVGTQTTQSGQERVRESAFNLSEAALNSTANFLSVQWPTAASPYPSSCTQASTTSSCPPTTGVTGSLTGGDFNGTVWSWSTEIHDNGAPTASFYSDTTTRAQPGYDANGDGTLWVRSSATVRGRTRTIAALVNTQQIRSVFPKNTITAGYFSVGNSGKKVIVDTKGSSSTPGTIAVRCSIPPSKTFPNTCLDYTPSKGQVIPDTRQDAYGGGNALSTSDLDLIRQRAQSLGSYYTSCPSSLTGALVFIEGPANCSYSANTTYNSASGTTPGPGFVVIVNGTLAIGGGATYYGLIYAANQQNSTGYVVTISGSAKVVGAVAVDGNGGVSVGASGNNLVFDRNVFNNVQANGNVTIVQNGWREL
jgi:Tfp pilus assembly protein PilX